MKSAYLLVMNNPEVEDQGRSDLEVPAWAFEVGGSRNKCCQEGPKVGNLAEWGRSWVNEVEGKHSCRHLEETWGSMMGKGVNRGQT